jgi:tetratricopeptide (TPR) repeat protein
VTHAHVTEEDLRRFAAKGLNLVHRQHILVRLLSQCPECREMAARLVEPLLSVEAPLASPAEAAYEGVISRFLDAAPSLLSRIRAENEARERFLTLVRPLDLSFEEILDRLDDTMPVRARADALLALSFEQRARDPGKMVDLAIAAKMIAVNLSLPEAGTEYAPTEIADLQARAWGELANAHRRDDCFSAAEDALTQAALARPKGSGDLMVVARLLDVEASLRTDQRRFDEAGRLLDLVHKLYQEVGEIHLAGRARISRGISLYYDGRYPEAVATLRDAVGLLDPLRDPQLVTIAKQHFLFSLAANGDFAEAAELYLRSGLREAFDGEPLNRLKVRWLEARLHAGLGKVRRAEKAFAEVHSGFLAAGVEHEGALVGLEYAGILFEQGRFDEVEDLAAEALETFELLNIGAEAVKAVRALHNAFVARRATQALVREVVQFLERFDHRPYLRFRG